MVLGVDREQHVQALLDAGVQDVAEAQRQLARLGEHPAVPHAQAQQRPGPLGPVDRPVGQLGGAAVGHVTREQARGVVALGQQRGRARVDEEGRVGEAGCPELDTQVVELDLGLAKQRAGEVVRAPAVDDTGHAERRGDHEPAELHRVGHHQVRLPGAAERHQVVDVTAEPGAPALADRVPLGVRAAVHAGPVGHRHGTGPGQTLAGLAAADRTGVEAGRGGELHQLGVAGHDHLVPGRAQRPGQRHHRHDVAGDQSGH
ncbi:hypothetical protein SXANM310S_03896 [Streptomyces xanthochromogenes]